MSQSSISTRVMSKVSEIGIKNEFFSIDDIPRTRRKKVKICEQFYKDKNFTLLAWLKDVVIYR